MYRDPIIDEIHKYREEHAAEFNYNIRKVVEYYMKRQKQSNKKIVNFIKRKEEEEKIIPQKK